MEGSFAHTSSGEDQSDAYCSGAQFAGRKTVFFTDSTVYPVSPSSSPSGTPRSAFREITQRVRRRPSFTTGSASAFKAPSELRMNDPSNPDSVPWYFHFHFPLPRGSRPGEFMPASFSSSRLVDTSPRDRAFIESSTISYKVTATWHATEGDPIMLVFCLAHLMHAVGLPLMHAVWRPHSCMNQRRISTHKG